MNKGMLNRFFYLDKIRFLYENNFGVIKKQIISYLFCCFVILLFLIHPFTSLARSGELKKPEQIESEAAEHYEVTKDRMSHIYDRAMNDIINNPDKVLEGKTTGEWIYYKVYYCYNAICSVAPYFGGMSILVGLGICFITRRNKLMIKRALMYLVFGVPLALVIIVFGIGAII